MAETIENLRKAFTGESKANRLYLAFARKADEEGYTQIAKLFRAAAEAETIHALNHLRILGEIKSTNENLETAIEGETFEFKEMYPEFINVAKLEENQKASWSFDVANQVEEVHARLFKTASDKLEKNNGFDQVDFYVCDTCGNTIEGRPPERCPICGVSKQRFFKIV